MRTLFFTCCLLLCVNNLQAQQLPLFTQYREYNAIINPGSVPVDYLTYEYNFSAGLSYRNQFAGIPNGIKNQVGRFEWLSSEKKIMLSGYGIRDQTGPTSTTGGFLRLGYLLSYNPEESGLAFGLSAGAAQFAIETDKIDWKDKDDPIINGRVTKIYPDVGFGAFYYRPLPWGYDGDKLYMGVSVPQVFGLDVNLVDNSSDFKLTRVQHIYANLGFIQSLGESSFMEPTLWVKYVQGAPLNADLNLRFQLSQLMLVGIGYSTANSLHMEAGVQIGDAIGLNDKLLRLGYSFDRYFSQIGPLFGPTHEINLVYAFKTSGRRY